MADTIRVAAVQLGAGADIDENLATCLRMIDEAATHQPDLMVLPEFCNHLSWYEDAAHCYKVSVPLDGDFLNAIAAKANEHSCYIVINCTIQKTDEVATGSSMLYGPDGALLSVSDKQVLMGHENWYLQKAKEAAPIVELPFGKVATYACMDGVINETPRGLALRGADILCNSLNSFAIDEGNLHVPVRAAENKAFVVAANKVHPLIPEFMLEGVSAQTAIPIEFLHGAGESQIVAPDGTVLAKGPKLGDAVVVADIDVSAAGNKLRPDGTDVFANRRPNLYAPIGQQPAETDHPVGAASIEAAVYQVADGSTLEEAAEAVKTAAAAGMTLVVLPELFCLDGGVTGDNAADLCAQAIETITAALAGSSTHVVTSVVEGNAHVGVLLGADGVVARQAQLHSSARHAGWATELGDGLQVVQMAWGRLAIVVGDDAVYPETFRLAVMQGADVVAVPFSALEKWETELGLLERSAENRVCIVAATRPTDAGTSLITTLHNDFTLMTPWETRPFDGYISYPLVTRADDKAGLTGTQIHPAHTQNKVISAETDLVSGRPWYIAEAITS